MRLPVAEDRLRTYEQVLGRYHIYPEPKFLNADYTDLGPTARRHVRATAVEYIGKEANRWEEQFYLGEEPEAQIEYGAPPSAVAETLDVLRGSMAGLSDSALARASGVARRIVWAFRRGDGAQQSGTLARLRRGVTLLRERQDAHQRR